MEKNIGKREFIATLLMAGYTRTPMNGHEWYSHPDRHAVVEFVGRDVYFPKQNSAMTPNTIEAGFRIWKQLVCTGNLARSRTKQLEEEARQSYEHLRDNNQAAA